MLTRMTSRGGFLVGSDCHNPSMRDELDSEQLHAVGAILLHQLGDTETAGLLAEVAELEAILWNTEDDYVGYKVVLKVDPHLLVRFTDDVLVRIERSLEHALADQGSVDEIVVRPVLPRVGTDWRQQLRGETGAKPTNQARRVRLEPEHPMEDGLHFTNRWEHGVYLILKERQAALPDNDTIGIMPLGAMRVRGRTFEPDLLVTYRGNAGVIEIDGPHHKGRASDDRSRDRLLQHAGIRYVDRLDVRDTTQKADVEKFVTDFLKRLGS